MTIYNIAGAGTVTGATVATAGATGQALQANRATLRVPSVTANSCGF